MGFNQLIISGFPGRPFTHITIVGYVKLHMYVLHWHPICISDQHKKVHSREYSLQLSFNEQ